VLAQAKHETLYEKQTKSKRTVATAQVAEHLRTEKKGISMEGVAMHADSGFHPGCTMESSITIQKNALWKFSLKLFTMQDIATSPLHGLGLQAQHSVQLNKSHYTFWFLGLFPCTLLYPIISFLDHRDIVFFPIITLELWIC
jgi:hypothetical protein